MIQKWHYAGHYWIILLQGAPSMVAYCDTTTTLPGSHRDGSKKSLFPYSSQPERSKMAEGEKHITVLSWKICIFEKVVECCVGFVKWLYETILPPQQTKKVWNENQNHHFTTAQFGILDFRNERSFPSGKLPINKNDHLNIPWMMK